MNTNNWLWRSVSVMWYFHLLIMDGAMCNFFCTQVQLQLRNQIKLKVQHPYQRIRLNNWNVSRWCVLPIVNFQNYRPMREDGKGVAGYTYSLIFLAKCHETLLRHFRTFQKSKPSWRNAKEQKGNLGNFSNKLILAIIDIFNR